MILNQSNPNATLPTLYELVRRARAAASTTELGFLLVNETHLLTPYRQGMLWFADQGLQSHSGVVVPDEHAPYGQWVNKVCDGIVKREELAKVSAVRVGPSNVPSEMAADWAAWWPVHGLWVGLPGTRGLKPGGLLLVREEAWSDDDLLLLTEWLDAWWHAFRALRPTTPWNLRSLGALVADWFRPKAGQAWWKQPLVRWGVVLLFVMVFPVRLSVLAPGELVPAHPTVIRAPLDGVVSVFHVQPNQLVKQGQLLVGFDEALIQSRVDVAEQNLATAETEYRQTSQQALQDAKLRGQLALSTGKIEEKRAEVAFLRGQLERSRVTSPRDGVVLFADPAEWIGKPVTVGERILRIAEPEDSEVEVWLPLADAIDLSPGDAVTMYLNASPLSPVSARVRYVAHEAMPRPDGLFAYRLRATLSEKTNHRVGLKGTAKVQAGWVPLGFWILRRPIASLRTTLGI